MKKQIVLEEQDYHKLCNRIEGTYVSLGHMSGNLDNKDVLINELKEGSRGCREIMKFLDWTE